MGKDRSDKTHHVPKIGYKEKEYLELKKKKQCNKTETMNSYSTPRTE